MRRRTLPTLNKRDSRAVVIQPLQLHCAEEMVLRREVLTVNCGVSTRLWFSFEFTIAFQYTATQENLSVRVTTAGERPVPLPLEYER